MSDPYLEIEELKKKLAKTEAALVIATIREYNAGLALVENKQEEWIAGRDAAIAMYNKNLDEYGDKLWEVSGYAVKAM